MQTHHFFKCLIAIALCFFSPLSAATIYEHAYRGYSEVYFTLDDCQGLTVTIDTERFHLRSVEATEDYYDAYFSLFGDPAVMGKYATGQTKTKEEIQSRIEGSWVKRWRENDPYSALAIFKRDTGEFIGHVVMGHGDDPGQSELAFLLLKQYWDKGYGTEAVMAVVHDYAIATIREGYTLEGKVLEKITASARVDNVASLKIMEKVGMRKTFQDEKYGAPRYHYEFLLHWPQEPIVKLLASRKSMILAPVARTHEVGSAGGGEDILGKVEEPPPGQEVAKWRFYAAKSFTIGSIAQGLQTR